MTNEKDDPIVAEVREVRSRMNKEANYDLHKLLEMAAEAVRRYGFKLSDLAPLQARNFHA